MLLIRLINFLKGYVVLSAEGFFLERFLNLAAHNNIYLWNVRRLGSQKMRVSLSAKAYSQIDEISAKTNVTTTVLHEKGLPFLMQKYRRRTSFVIGTILCFFMIITLSFFLWDIELDYTGSDVPHERIISELSYAGLRTGRPLFLIQREQAILHLMSAIPEFSWVGINIQGTRAIVQITETRDAPEIEDTTLPCNIIAMRAGVIEEIHTLLGEPLVEAGTAIAEGQLLVSGVIDSPQLGTRLLHASAEITARTWLEESTTAILHVELRPRTSRTRSFHSLELFGFRIPLYFRGEMPFAEFERHVWSRYLTLGRNLLLPFAFHYDKFYEVEVVRQPISEEEAIRNAHARLVESLISQLLPNSQILGETTTLSTSPAGETVVTVTFENLEHIGRKVEIAID